MTGDSEGSEHPLTRRGYLGALGSAAAVAVGTAGTAGTVTASEHGYGQSGYGTDPYGGTEEESDSDGSEEKDAIPTIEGLTGEDASNPRNPHVDAELAWQASIDDSELYAALLTLSDPDGELETWKYNLSGQTAEGAETTRIPQGAREEGTEYVVDLVVYSYYGNTDQQTITFESQ